MKKNIIIADGCKRSDVLPSLHVSIVLKENQKTGKLNNGYVQDILTNKPYHSRGIKVRLTNGMIGRVQKILNQEGLSSCKTN